MPEVRSSLALKLVLVAIILWLQTMSFAHAALHGDEPHEHEGVPCEMVLLATEDMAVLPVPAARFFAPTGLQDYASPTQKNDQLDLAA